MVRWSVLVRGCFNRMLINMYTSNRYQETPEKNWQTPIHASGWINLAALKFWTDRVFNIGKHIPSHKGHQKPIP